MNDFQQYSELYHYGVLGMKWGVRRYQPYPKGHKGGKEIGSAKEVTRQLESHSRTGADNQRAMNIAKDKMSRSKKGSKKYEKFKKHYEEAKKSKEYADKEIKKVLSKIDKKKYDVYKTAISDYRRTPGQNIAPTMATLLGGWPIGLGIIAANRLNKKNYVDRWAYTVKEKKK